MNVHFSLLVRGMFSSFCLILERVCDQEKVKNHGNRTRPAFPKLCFMRLNRLCDVIKSSCGQISLRNTL